MEFYKKFGEAHLMSLFFLLSVLSSCEGGEKINYTYDNCSQCTGGVHFSEKGSSSQNMIQLLCPERFGGIDVNIPPKVQGGRLLLLSTRNYLLEYDLSLDDSCLQAKVLGQLPSIFPFISDYALDGEGILMTTRGEDNDVVVKFTPSSNQLDTVLHGEKLIWSSMPYLGMTFYDLNERRLFPFVKESDYNKGNYLAVFSEKFEYEKGIGASRAYYEESYAPYYDTPIISGIRNRVFYATYSSRDGAVKCELNDDYEIEMGEVYCFPKLGCECETQCIPKVKFGDYEFQTEKYVTACFTTKLMATNSALYRIGKECQDQVNPITRKLNRIGDAPWVLDKYMFDSGKVDRVYFGAQKYLPSSSFIYDGLMYVQRQNDNSKMIVFDGF